MYYKKNKLSVKLNKHETFNEKYFAKIDGRNTLAMHISRPKHFCYNLNTSSEEIADHKITKNDEAGYYKMIKKKEKKIADSDHLYFTKLSNIVSS